MSTDFFDEHSSPELRAMIRYGQMHKLAAVKFGMDVLDEAKVAAYFGEKLAARRRERREIFQGLFALNELQK